MFNFSELKGKKVIALYEAEILGEIENAVTDNFLKKARYFQVKNQDNETIYFPYSLIASVGDDAVMLKNKSKIFSRETIPSPLAVLPLASSVYTHNGKALGSVTDLKFDGDKIVKLIVGDSEIEPCKILSRSQEVIVVNDGEDKVKLVPPVSQEPKKVMAEEKAEIIAPLASEELPSEPTSPVVPKRASTASLSTAQNDKTAGYSFLLGRIATDALLSASGEIIVESGQTIDETVINKASSSDKLVQLALRSK
jgi:sporulation protein YlmC with PRC-barrel domain